ncbi:AI-2E family transporter [Defluviimonas sp. WL0002]|uniref:AI-2E family transporter n=1 Tax=Albidovulum marisflavi TaxID=2984159 RepID=A0ABT2ZDM2_9RHOB|nr:AI-2E family transporter [Defluviimonas sp. WL0002]MCV2868846.1 AI-2E family transporter [Defluviimonas sp. WL0002]
MAIVVAALALWALRSLVLVIFAAILVALLLDAAARTLQRVVPVGQTVAVLASVVVLLGLFLGTIGVLGAQTLAELSELSSKIPTAVNQLEDWIDIGSIEAWITERLQSSDGTISILNGISGMTSFVISAGTGVGLALAGGVFIALNPSLYRNGAVCLMPQRFRDKGGQTLRVAGNALRAFLLGQLVAMLAVGLMTTVGLWFLGVSTAIALGVIAGLLEFIPYVGPVASAIPAIAVGLVDGPTTALWVALLYVAIQQIEGTLLIPLIQRETVDLPPAVTVFSVVGFGLMFGPAGFVLAAPLTVLMIVVTRQIWIPYANGQRDPESQG